MFPSEKTRGVCYKLHTRFVALEENTLGKKWMRKDVDCLIEAVSYFLSIKSSMHCREWKPASFQWNRGIYFSQSKPQGQRSEFHTFNI